MLGAGPGLTQRLDDGLQAAGGLLLGIRVAEAAGPDRCRAGDADAVAEAHRPREAHAQLERRARGNALSLSGQLREDWLELGLEPGLRPGADQAGRHVAVLEDDHRRDREDLILRRGLRVLVGVEADDREVLALGV